jgi:hypothetical protein
MKRTSRLYITGLLILLCCTACAQMQSMMPHGSTAQAQPPHPTTTVAANSYGSDNQMCSGIAQKRLSLYDRPDTYPISDKERGDAYKALYSECMSEHNWQVAGNAAPYAALSPSAGSNNPVHGVPLPGSVVADGGAASYAALSPAAGGNNPVAGIAAASSGNTVISSSSVPGATILVIGGNKDTLAQLSSLSPSSGRTQGNATVVLVQSPQNAPYAPNSAYYPPVPYAHATAPANLPVAIPVPPSPRIAVPQTQGFVNPGTPAYVPPPPASAPSLAGADAASSYSPPQPSESLPPVTENVLER